MSSWPPPDFKENKQRGTLALEHAGQRHCPVGTTRADKNRQRNHQRGRATSAGLRVRTSEHT
eukprot:7374956-Alexandrium_andersonii.AAC.1